MWPLAVVYPDLELRGEGGFACPAGFSFLLLLFITQNEEGGGGGNFTRSVTVCERLYFSIAFLGELQYD